MPRRHHSPQLGPRTPRRSTKIIAICSVGAAALGTLGLSVFAVSRVLLRPGGQNNFGSNTILPTTTTATTVGNSESTAMSTTTTMPGLHSKPKIDVYRDTLLTQSSQVVITFPDGSQEPVMLAVEDPAGNILTDQVAWTSDYLPNNPPVLPPGAPAEITVTPDQAIPAGAHQVTVFATLSGSLPSGRYHVVRLGGLGVTSRAPFDGKSQRTIEY